jgi:hypothetical protein
VIGAGGDPNGLEGQVLLGGGPPGVTVNNPEFSTAMSIRMQVRDPDAGGQDGAGIARVIFSIEGPEGDDVYRHTEANAWYCAFGGGAPKCNAFVFADNGYRWPQSDVPSTPMQNGGHTMRIRVERNGSD